MTRWQAGEYGGRRIQAGIPLTPQRQDYVSARGLLFRGVVTATYELDNPNHPEADTAGGVSAVAIYCDVLVYSSMWNQRFQMLKACVVSQELGGMHRGRVWKPRATKLDKTGSAVDIDRATNPAELDGDHVLVSFLDDNLNQPIIIRGIPHPSADFGNEDKVAGKRLRLKVADGDPDFWKHHGAFFGVSDAGNFVVDTTEAYAGEALLENGKERPAVEDGTTGNYTVRLPKGAKLTVQIEGGATLEVDLKDADAKFTLGDGAKSAIIAETLQTFWDSTVKPALDEWAGPAGHKHGTGVGPSGVPIPPFVTPTFDAAAISSKIKFPNG